MCDTSKFPRETLVVELQYKVSFLSKKLNGTPLKEMYQDTMMLDHNLLLFTNKVVFDSIDMDHRLVMAHIAHLGSRIDAVDNFLQVNATQNNHICVLFSKYGMDLTGIILQRMQSIMDADAVNLSQIESFFVSTGAKGVSNVALLMHVAPNRPTLEEQLMERLSYVKARVNKNPAPHQ